MQHLFEQNENYKKSHSWVEIDHNKIIQNVKILKGFIGNQVQLAAVIKSNAYGHGIVPISKILQKVDEVGWVISCLLSEALQARQAGFKKPILVCGYADGNISDAALQCIDLTIHDQSSLERYTKTSKELNRPIYVHLKVDTGLTRLGFSSEEAIKVLIGLQGSEHIIVRGIFSHFAESDAKDIWYIKQQQDQFDDLLGAVAKLGINIQIVHLANTVSTIRFPTTHNSLVRVGGGIYGLGKIMNHDKMPATYKNLQPAITWKSKIMQVKEVKSGTYISYNRTFKAPHNMKVAVIPVGYADGYGRELSNNSQVFINGALAPVVGRVCMNMIIVDVTVINVGVGDEVVLLGNIDGVRVSDFMHRLDTISYEVTNRINWTIPRVLV